MVVAMSNKHEDDTSSLASFEDVGPVQSSSDRTSLILKNLVLSGPEMKPETAEPVPDVLYVVQYRDVSGRLVDTRKSDKPIDVNKYGGKDDDMTKSRPVIEIVTKVKASIRRSGGRVRVRKCGGQQFVDDVYSDYSSDSETDDESLNVNKVETTEMTIHSKYLKSALSAVVGYYPGTEFISDRVVIPAPYRVLIHHRDALNQYKTSQPAHHSAEYKEMTMKHIDLLLGFLDKTFSEKLREEERRHMNNPPAATFRWFWMLFKPGEVMFAKQDGQWMPFVISQVRIVSSRNSKASEYNIIGWNINYSMGRLQRQMSTYSIRVFPGEQAIHTLPVIPARFFPEDLEKQGGMTMIQKQIALGKLYWELCKRPAYKEHDGLLVEKDYLPTPTGNFAGRVIVDAEGFERYGPGGRRPGGPPPPGHMVHNRPPPPPRDQLPAFSARCSCKTCSQRAREESGPFANFEDLDPKEDAAPTSDLYYIACSKVIPAFLLSDRRWGFLNIDSLQDVKADREAFKYLVLEDEIKLTVKALIGKFASADGKVSPWPRDLVKNKGEGRIFLLHGSPGVGKTCTAECVAELTHRPLLALTSGDISTDMSASSVERNLNYFLTLGERYGALVLLDEADVYLEERRTKDLQRNGLVSIFLRALEYYRGVLFLTTNRVEAFDSAFTSRIHVALHYRRLSDEDRLRIWNNNFERLERDSAGKVYVSMSTREFAYESEDVRALRWNGREIRNALQTAVALAETEALDDGSDKVNVTDKHLQAVVKMSKGFKDFLRRRRGWADADSDSDEEDDESSGSELMDD